MKRVVAGALSAITLLAAQNAFAACGTGKIHFSDSFDTLQKAWGDADKWMSVKNGQLQLAEMNNNFYTAWADPTFRNIDYCVEVTLTDTNDVTGAYGGLVFWMRDTDHFYTLQITLDGYADVYKYDGTWTAIIDDEAFSAVKQGKNVKNELRVVTHSGTATFYINGQKFDSIDETDSPGTSHVGVMVDSPKDGNATFAFDNLAVHDPIYEPIF